MNASKKHHSLSPRIFRRSLSEQDASTAALKDYHWYHRAKSRKLNKQLSFDSEKPLGAYRWQTHPWLPWRVSKREGKGECNDPSLAKSVDASSADFLLEDPAEALLPSRTRPFRAPFRRSLSEPVARSGSGNGRPFLLDTEHQGDFIRGIFSSLSSGFSKIRSRKGDPVSNSIAEGKTEDNQIGLSTGNELTSVSFCFYLCRKTHNSCLNCFIVFISSDALMLCHVYDSDALMFCLNF